MVNSALHIIVILKNGRLESCDVSLITMNETNNTHETISYSLSPSLQRYDLARVEIKNILLYISYFIS